MKYVTTEDAGRIINRTTYCACVAGYSNQGGVCKPVATHNWRIDLPKLAHDAETAAGNSQQPATGAGQR